MADSFSPRVVYLLTKIAVFGVAGALTWPLSLVIGPKAWWGLGVFGLILAGLTVVVFLAFGKGTSEPDEEAPFGEEPEEHDTFVQSGKRQILRL